MAETLTYETPMLSWGSQPALRQMFRAIAAPQSARHRVTILCGAGVSADAGLPDWAELIRRMANAILEPDLAEVVQKDPTSPMRKVDYLFRAADKITPPAELVRHALYLEEPQGSLPGQTADSVARLAKSFHGRAKLMTTNFDDSLEAALLPYVDDPAYIAAFGLHEREAWENWNVIPGHVGILHLHGQVVQGAAPKEPLILSESFFLEHGATVRDVIKQALTSSVVLAVGVSLTDPNLIGPLHDSRRKAKPGAFILVPADPIEGVSAKRSFEYAATKARHFQEVFSVEPVVLKAYSQVPQVLYDLSLARETWATYGGRAKSTSVRYGYRFRRTLDAAYEAAGVPHGTRTQTVSAARRLSDRLFRAMEARHGPVTILRQAASALSTSYLRDIGLTHDFLEEERFALFLWLRVPTSTGTSEPSPFALRCVGTSAYLHREAWSFQRQAQIEANSRLLAARVAFSGRATRDNILDERLWQLWRSAIAVPLVVSEAARQTDVLTLGVVSLQSTRRLVRPDTLRQAVASRENVELYEQPSVVPLVDPAVYAELLESLLGAGQRAIAG